MSKYIRYGKNLAFCLHIPDERQGYVLCYSLYENDELCIFVNHGQKQFHLSSLESDFYKNKKGPIIFVHETVVNAQAKTVE
ncbi:MAG: hypothetical protein SO238_11660 [Treponema sp.]|nr:hypothetical protein [Treponema sp.]